MEKIGLDMYLKRVYHIGEKYRNKIKAKYEIKIKSNILNIGYIKEVVEYGVYWEYESSW